MISDLFDSLCKYWSEITLLALVILGFVIIRPLLMYNSENKENKIISNIDSSDESVHDD